jgi:hypothetical protein
MAALPPGTGPPRLVPDPPSPPHASSPRPLAGATTPGGRTTPRPNSTGRRRTPPRGRTPRKTTRGSRACPTTPARRRCHRRRPSSRPPRTPSRARAPPPERGAVGDRDGRRGYRRGGDGRRRRVRVVRHCRPGQQRGPGGVGRGRRIGCRVGSRRGVDGRGNQSVGRGRRLRVAGDWRRRVRRKRGYCSTRSRHSAPIRRHGVVTRTRSVLVGRRELRSRRRRPFACRGWCYSASPVSTGAPTRLPHSVHEPS